MARPSRRSVRKSRARRKVRKNPGYGFLPLLPVVGIVGAGLTGYGLYKAYDLYDKLTRPAVLVGAAGGTVAGYKFGKGFFERIAYTSLGTGLGLLVDSYLNPEE